VPGIFEVTPSSGVEVFTHSFSNFCYFFELQLTYL
jgi:hypothetical protein